ncbi:MAG: acyl-CoA dehydrogenase family protein, partial [Dehalococcoidia bacterium]
RRDRDSMAYDASASLTLQEVDAPSVALSAEALEDWLLRRAVCAAAEAVGAARRSVELAVDYAMNRVQFGRPIGAFQAVQHPCADMALGLDGARFALREAAWAVDEGPDGVEDAAAVAHSALAYAHKALLHITANSHEVFGGVGFFVEHDLHYYTRRIASDLAVMGPASGHLEAVADAAGI